MSNLLYSLLDRVALRRRILEWVPLAAFRSRARGRRRSAFRERHADIAEHPLCRDQVLQHSLCRLPEEAFGLEASRQVIAQLVAAGAEAWRWPPRHDVLEAEQILGQYPPAYVLGLDPDLLDLAEAYLEEPCFYLSCCLKRERLGQSLTGTRQWHMDIEDDRMLRLIIYLNEVGEKDGPFQYLSTDRSDSVRKASGYRSGYLSDAVLSVFAPEEEWQSVCGVGGALFAFDGTRIFHRACPPSATERLSLTLSYASRHPRQIYYGSRLKRGTRRRLLESLSKRQQACVPPPLLF
jgi:hypothetical protein